VRRSLLAALLAGWCGLAVAQTPGGLPAPDGRPLPFALGGAYLLVDQEGRARSQADPAGHPQLLFFGYAACEQICSVALPTMAEAARSLQAAGIPVTPVMITVDPARDTSEVMGRKLRALHPGFIGLTGSEEALEEAYAAFGIEHEVVYVDPFLGDVFAHGSFVYLLDADGTFLTLFPPILAPERVAGIVRAHVRASTGG
jgi:protein SCO1